MAVIYPFGEGATEKVVFEFLKTKLKDGKFRQFNVVDGKHNFPNKIKSVVKSEVEAKRDDIRIVAFRDLDDGENINDILNSFQKIVHELLTSWGTNPGAEEIVPQSVYKWEVTKDKKHPEFKFVLHIAKIDGLKISLRNQTTDAYILQLGLSEYVLKRFATESKVGSDYKIVRELITSSLPDLIAQNGITFDEDKDYLAAYLVATRFWVIKRTEEQARLIKIILERGWRHNREGFEEIFDSWIRAINEVIE